MFVYKYSELLYQQISLNYSNKNVWRLVFGQYEAITNNRANKWRNWLALSVEIVNNFKKFSEFFFFSFFGLESLWFLVVEIRERLYLWKKQMKSKGNQSEHNKPSCIFLQEFFHATMPLNVLMFFENGMNINKFHIGQMLWLNSD